MKKHGHVPLLGVLCFGLFLLPSTLQGQERATIVGTVTDPSAAIMPGVRATITNTDTGVTREVETNDAGNYIAPGLVPGRYEVRAESTGFRPYSRTDIVLNVNDTVRVDIPMQVGDVTQSVTVTESAVRVQTESGEVSDVITGTQVTQLAVNTRNFFALATLTTGVSSDMPDFNLPIPVGSNSTIRFNGLRNDHNVWMIDGGENYDRGCGGCVSVMPSMDALSEFKIMTSNYGADFGIGSAGTVNMMLKSGTQEFHGSVYEYHRNDAADAADFFTNRAGGSKAHLRYNNFGWNFGGPFYIPGKYNTSKNKTFFFFNQEWRRVRQGTTVNAPAINQALRDGDFSSYPAGAILVPQTTDPVMLAKYAAEGLTPGQPFPNNTIPASLIDPNAALYLGTGAFPVPNAPNDFFTGSRAVPINVREEIIRVDHHVSDKLSIMAHFINDAVLQETPTTLWAGSTYPTMGTLFMNPGKHAVLRITYTISPTLINEFAYNYNGNRIDLTPTGIFAKPSGTTIQELFSGNREDRLPQVNLGTPFNVNFQPGSWPWHNAADSQQVRDDVSKMIGGHALKFGAQLMRYRKNQDIFGTTEGSYTFDGTFTGDSVADFLLGFAKSYNELAVQDRGHWRNTTFSFYLTDSWRATSHLTLNLGARYELIPRVYEIENRMSNFYPDLYDSAQEPTFNDDGSLDPTGPGFATVSGVPLSDIPFYLNGVRLAGEGIPKGMVNNYYNTVAPRIGFAYDLTGAGKTVIRGGYGMFYERIQGNDVYNGGPNPPFSFSPGLDLVYFSDPSVSALNGEKAAVPIFPGSFYALAKDYLIPTTHQWSFGIQHELAPRAVLSVSYVGNQNSHQRVQRNINMPLLEDARRAEVREGTLGANLIRPFPGFSSITYAENSTSANYNSLQVNMRMNNYRGLTLQTAYTWAHAVDIVSGDFNEVSNPYDMAFSRASSDLDRRHVLTFNYVYDLPFGKGHPNAAVRQILGGWQLSGITTFQSGLPTTVTYPGDNAGVGGGVGTRPDLIGDPNAGPKTVGQWFNTSAFTDPAPLSFGTAGRNIVNRPGRNNWNISVFKLFTGIPFPTSQEGAQMQFRFEFFNAFNHTQFNGLFTTFAGSGFGGVSSTHDARRIQFGVRFLF